MIGLSSPASVFVWAIGIADADRIGASARVQAANPINKKRFMKFCSLDSVIAVIDNASALGLFHGWNTQGNGPSADCARRPLVSELPAGWGLGAQVGQPRFLHSRIR
jgi:hypothetical protein